jgi:hypothetical protein
MPLIKVTLSPDLYAWLRIQSFNLDAESDSERVRNAVKVLRRSLVVVSFRA